MLPKYEGGLEQSVTFRTLPFLSPELSPLFVWINASSTEPVIFLGLGIGFEPPVK